MTDRTQRLTVVLDADYRTDDVKAIVDAIAMVRGVVSVHINVRDERDLAAVERAKFDLRLKFMELLKGGS
jgi:hypothetical protein